MKKKIGIILEFGFHDLKKYIYNDFGSELGRYFDIVWLAVQKNSNEFHSLFIGTGFPIVYFDPKDFVDLIKTEGRNQTIRREWMARKELGQFHNYRTLNSSHLRQIILGNQIIKRIFEVRTLKLVKARYYNKIVEATIRDHNIQLILGTGYSSSFAKSIFVTANKSGLPTYLLVNNWKDLYINNFVPFNFLSSVFVWNKNMKDDFLTHMPYLKEENLIVSGNPVFDSLIKSKPKFDRAYYSKKYNINKDAEWIYYTMMSPLAGIREIEIVKLIAKEISTAFTRNEMIILLRKNPQHTKEDFTNETIGDNIVLTDHYSFFDRGKDMHTQSPEGEQEWVDLLHHCSLNMSVPSTVTLEFLALEKSVLNIGFGPDGNPDPRFRQHFEAGFYRHLFMAENGVKKVLRIGDLLKELTAAKKIKIYPKFPELNHSASEIIVNKLLE